MLFLMVGSDEDVDPDAGSHLIDSYSLVGSFFYGWPAHTIVHYFVVERMLTQLNCW